MQCAKKNNNFVKYFRLKLKLISKSVLCGIEVTFSLYPNLFEYNSNHTEYISITIPKHNSIYTAIYVCWPFYYISLQYWKLY